MNNYGSSHNINLINDDVDTDNNTDSENLDYLISSDNENIKMKKINATTAIDINVISDNDKNNDIITYDNNTNTDTDIDNDLPNFIDEHSTRSLSHIIMNAHKQKQNKKPISPIKINKKDNDINGWDDDATETITNWYHTFKQQSFIYQYVLDKNRKMSDTLSIISIISSAALGVFAGFKLWVHNDLLFQTISDILLMLSNFIVALITALSKRYNDDKRNEQIRLYVEDVDHFIGELSAQVLKSPVYRMNADRFFKQNNNKYTKLISTAPNLSIKEINQGKQKFIVYNDYCKY